MLPTGRHSPKAALTAWAALDLGGECGESMLTRRQVLSGGVQGPDLGAQGRAPGVP